MCFFRLIGPKTLSTEERKIEPLSEEVLKVSSEEEESEPFSEVLQVSSEEEESESRSEEVLLSSFLFQLAFSLVGVV
jgi:hypothetical protein